MANLVITNGCNLHCPFCFASEYRQEEDRACIMNWAEFCYQLDFADTDTVRFCGGEPTLHPDFCRMVDYVLENTDRSIFVMTNGLWPEQVSTFIRKLSRRRLKRIFFMVNVLPYTQYSEQEHYRLENTLKIIKANHTTLAVTIYQRNPDFDYHFELLKKFNIKTLRYSLAAPNITDQRSWNLLPERDFPALGRVLTELLKLCLDWGIYLQSDCGYLPWCYWPKEGQYLLSKISDKVAEINFSCQGPLDIGPDGQAWRCFGLKSLTKTNTRHFPNVQELAASLTTEEERFHDYFIKVECRECPHRRSGRCGGGCLALRRTLALWEQARQAGFDLANDIELLDCYLAPGSRLRIFQRPQETKAYRLIQQEWEELPLTRDLLALLDNRERKPLGQLLNSMNLMAATPSILRQIRELYAQDLVTLSLNLEVA